MKSRILTFISILASSIFLMSCIENDPVVFKDTVVEFDAAVWNTPATGVTYPILTRVPGYGRAVSTNATAPSVADPLITRTSGNISFQLNLVGAQTGSDRTVAVSVVSTGTTAVAGTHYTLPASVTIPANSSFGILTVTVLNPGATSGTRDLIIQIDGGTDVKPSENYKTIGLRIAQN